MPGGPNQSCHQTLPETAPAPPNMIVVFNYAMSERRYYRYMLK
jgi:hypothetical protein